MNQFKNIWYEELKWYNNNYFKDLNPKYHTILDGEQFNYEFTIMKLPSQTILCLECFISLLNEPDNEILEKAWDAFHDGDEVSFEGKKFFFLDEPNQDN